MARTRKDIAAELFEAALFNQPIQIQLLVNKHVTNTSPKRKYIEIYTVREEKQGSYTLHRRAKTLFRCFITDDQYRNLFIPNGGFTPGQVLKLFDQFEKQRVIGPDPWRDK